MFNTIGLSLSVLGHKHKAGSIYNDYTSLARPCAVSARSLSISEAPTAGSEGTRTRDNTHRSLF